MTGDDTAPDETRIMAAAARLAGHVRETPLLRDPALDAIAGRPVWVKAECLQHTGSFKYRGAKAAVTALCAAGSVAGVVACSSGNHGQGVARAAREAGIAAVIVLPDDAPDPKVAAIRANGAEIVTHDRHGADRHAIAAAICAARGFAFIPPFDHPDVIAGQAGVGLEIAAQVRATGVTQADVLVCCGGGGLAAGIALALEPRAPGLRVCTVEPEGYDDTARALAGAPGPNPPGARSVCDAILTPAPGRLTLPVLARLAGPGRTVTDDAALRAMTLAFAHLRIVLEPGGAVALAAALDWTDAADTPVIAVATGGNVDPALFARAIRAGT
ncbi:threonine ammonia-lyase [Meridianimarinicoccus sp. RP-17]|uniref:threonine ammonia-lyase n=1 Tax=Meridianimarinicoccus zhengii TaxID=2056810 RepID=UPI000DAF4110|nr:pyridoxal-phosphate dependent enzyme [Phycocomes zhengii]